MSRAAPPLESVPVAVALVLDEAKQALLWTWNAKWRTFALPMSRIRPADGRRTGGGAAPRVAAERAAAEALGVPVVVDQWRQAAPILERSGRDDTLRSYTYTVYRAEAHPRFAGREVLADRSIWLAAHEALSGEVRPLSPACVKLVDQLVAAKLLPGRRQLVSSVLLWRRQGNKEFVLMRTNPDWGYFLPSKRRAEGEPALDAAERVASEELGLTPGEHVELTPEGDGPLTFHDQSESTDEPTYYVHHVFAAALQYGGKLASAAPLVWVSLEEIVAGRTQGIAAVGTGIPPAPGPVSRTAKRLLEGLGYL